jgi:hypothetical protein
MADIDWRDAKYEEVYSDTLRGLERRRQHDACFSIADAEGVLRHLYIQDGNDWTGRGEVQDLLLAATIAAYESFIAAWKATPPSPFKQEPPCQ